MARQWIRAVGLHLEGSGGDLDLSAFRIHFIVKQDTTQSPNNAIIRVYNLAKETALRIVKSGEFKQVTLSAGYVENNGVIFQGTIVQSQAGRENPTDTFLDIYAVEGDIAYNWAVANKTLAAGSTLMDHVNVMADAMKPFGIKLGYVPTELLQKIKFPRAVTFMGMAKDYLRTIAATIESTWSIQGDELRIVEKGKSLGGIREMNSQTGMIGMPIQTQGSITVRCLIDPQIKVHSQIHINQASIQPAALDLSYMGAKVNAKLPSVTEDGIYTVYIIDKIGDTHRTEWYYEMQCLAAGDAPPPGSPIQNSPEAAKGMNWTPAEGG